MFLILALLLLQNEIRVTKHEAIEAARGIPAAVSADGKRIVFIKKTGDAYAYWTADGEGRNAKEIFKTPVDWEDILVPFVSASMVSPDGARFAVATTKDDGGYRHSRDPIRMAVIDAAGKAVKMECTSHWSSGAGWVGSSLLFLDSADPRSGETGYALRAWDGKKTEEIASSKDDLGLLLQISPDGGKAAFFVGKPAEGRMRLRVVDLKSKASTDSEEFRTDDVTFDGTPMFYWDGAGRGLFYHACPESGKTPFHLMRFDLERKASAKVVEEDDVAVTAVLDKEWIAVYRRGTKRSGLLRLSDGKVHDLPEGLAVIGAGGRTAVVREKGEVRVATLDLPK